MALNSINTNASALTALANLATTQTSLQQTQNIISTGKKINSAKDKARRFGPIERQVLYMKGKVRKRSTSGEGQRSIGPSPPSSSGDVGRPAGFRPLCPDREDPEVLFAAAWTRGLDTTSRQALNADFKSLRDQITSVVNNADFNGVNMVKSGGTTIYALANDSGSSKLTVLAEDLSLGGGNVTLSATASFNSASAASAYIGTIDTDLTNVNTALTKLGTGSNALASHETFVQSLQTSCRPALSNLVDADMAKESATLPIWCDRQQLGVQALSIAQSRPPASCCSASVR